MGGRFSQQPLGRLRRWCHEGEGPGIEVYRRLGIWRLLFWAGFAVLVAMMPADPKVTWVKRMAFAGVVVFEFLRPRRAYLLSATHLIYRPRFGDLDVLFALEDVTEVKKGRVISGKRFWGGFSYGPGIRVWTTTTPRHYPLVYLLDVNGEDELVEKLIAVAEKNCAVRADVRPG